jgi:protein SCO1/2
VVRGERVHSARPGLLRCLVTALALVSSQLSTEAAGELSPDRLPQLTFEQKPGMSLSLELPFRDENGRTVRLGDYFGQKPVILVLGYYGCPMLCTLVLNGLVESLQDLKLDIGDEFDVINVSIDPTETAALAAAKKQTYLKRYGRRGAAQGWHFLTSDETSIRRLAEQVGFRYAYDSTARQYAHPSGIVILTPQGKVSRYFFGIRYPAKELGGALRQASANEAGSPIEQLFMLCFHYNPITGRYGALVMTMLRVVGVATLLALGWMVVAMVRREKSGRVTAEAERQASIQECP